MKASEARRFMKRSVLRLDIAREGLDWKKEWQNVVCMVQWGVECPVRPGRKTEGGWMADGLDV